MYSIIAFLLMHTLMSIVELTIITPKWASFFVFLKSCLPFFFCSKCCNCRSLQVKVVVNLLLSKHLALKSNVRNVFSHLRNLNPSRYECIVAPRSCNTRRHECLATCVGERDYFWTGCDVNEMCTCMSVNVDKLTLLRIF